MYVGFGIFLKVRNFWFKNIMLYFLNLNIYFKVLKFSIYLKKVNSEIEIVLNEKYVMVCY